jgi:hypothetical protein
VVWFLWAVSEARTNNDHLTLNWSPAGRRVERGLLLVNDLLIVDGFELNRSFDGKFQPILAI